ncbi:MAG TPA: COQ9 family protein, partial [Novosphingobium sp.]|nr:COQ9 family protein [Novosphingobium sp.]
MADTAQSTLTDIRLTLAPALAAAAAFDGWSEAAVQAAAAETGIDPEVAHYAFVDGPMAMISAWIAHVDLAMAGALPAGALAAMPVRERVRSLIVARLDAQRGYEEALRRAQSIMALPGNAAQSLRLGWQTADAIWRLAGDRATDYNH